MINTWCGINKGISKWQDCVLCAFAWTFLRSLREPQNAQNYPAWSINIFGKGKSTTENSFMKNIILIAIFLGLYCYSDAQFSDKSDSCLLLQNILNTDTVKKFLYSRSRFMGFCNKSSFFQNCKSLLIDGKEYTIYNETKVNHQICNLLIYMYIKHLSILQ